MRTGDDLRKLRRVRLRVAVIVPVAALTALAAGIARESPRSLETAAPQTEETVRIGVLTLFHARELRFWSAGTSGLQVAVDGQARMVGQEAATVRLSGGQLEVQFGSRASAIAGGTLRAFSESPADSGRFWLEIPGKLRREYTGSLEIQTHTSEHGQSLEMVVTMPLETAVASVVAAESPPGAGLEALKAQAVAARSFLVARQAGHKDFDFCDTTHCQFLRSPPEPGSAADKASRATRGLVLTWHDDAQARDRTLAAMYARSCAGRTRTLREAGVRSDGYPYYAVRCDYCSRHPEVWQREVKGAPQTEQQRLAFNRIHGWGAIPSLPAGTAGSDGEMEGRGVGHGIGLCQLGAAEMARQGASFAQILAHYFPNTKLATIAEP